MPDLQPQVTMKGQDIAMCQLSSETIGAFWDRFEQILDIAARLRQAIYAVDLSRSHQIGIGLIDRLLYQGHTSISIVLGS
jgi:hypothetical protein